MTRLLKLTLSHTPALRLGIVVASAAIALGALLGFAGPVITLGVLLAMAATLWALTNLEVGLWGVIAVITLLPFGALPFKIIFTPTFLDLAMLGVVTVYLFHWMTGRRRQLTLTPAHLPIAVFLTLAVFSFVAGKDNGPLTANLVRQFAALLLNIGFAFILVDYLDQFDKLARTVRVILIGGTAAAALGILLYFLPPSFSERALSALSVFGYPDGGVLRYIEDSPENAQRAISTSVDPNLLGGLLAIIGGLLAPHILAGRPVLWKRWLSYAAFATVLVCLVLTFSRGALAALGASLGAIALVRYRRMLWVMAVVAVVIVILPATRDYVVHFVQGVRGEDLATQMRLGEYKDAFILIRRYPVLGVGFAGTPEIDIYLGVSSAYLLIAEQMGLVGLAAFLVIILLVFGWGYRHRFAVYAAEGTQGADAGLAAVWLGAHAGLVAALAVGVVDHYFFQLSFQPAGAIFWIVVGLCLAATRLGLCRRLHLSAV